MTISVCGLVCDECEHFQKLCKGCNHVKGKTFWAKDHLENKICPLFDCAVNKKNLNSCGNCNKLPCNKFKDLKDPSISDEDHLTSIIKRVELLNSLS